MTSDATDRPGPGPDPGLPDQPHARTAEAVCQALGVQPDQGLGDHEVASRRRRHGANRFR